MVHDNDNDHVDMMTIAHELIHAYDLCRANVDTSNCDHHACTEVLYHFTV
jgi:hypothetical protein